MTKSNDASKGIQNNLESRKNLSPKVPLSKTQKKNKNPVRCRGAAEAKPLCEEIGGLGQGITSQPAPGSPYTSLGIDLNIVPNSDEVATPLVGTSREEKTNRALFLVGDENCVGQVAMSHGRGESEDVVLRVEGGGQKKSARLEAALDSDILVTGHPSGIQEGESSDEKLKRCIKTILQLEESNLIKKHFRLNFLTWYTTMSTEWEKTAVNTFIELFEDPSSLAEQLIHTFSAPIFLASRRGNELGNPWKVLEEVEKGVKSL